MQHIHDISGAASEQDVRSKIQDLLDDAAALIELNSTDDNYRTLSVKSAARVLAIIRDKVEEAATLGQAYAKRHPTFPPL